MAGIGDLPERILTDEDFDQACVTVAATSNADNIGVVMAVLVFAEVVRHGLEEIADKMGKS